MITYGLFSEANRSRALAIDETLPTDRYLALRRLIGERASASSCQTAYRLAVFLPDKVRRRL